MTYHIHRVAVLGAGTMGAAIAAQAANAGLSVDLLDIVPPGAQDKERNNIVKAGFERMLKAKPAALMQQDLAEHIRLGNFEDHFERLKEADWILEVILEKLEPKQELMARIEQVAHPDAIISSNTSGIPLSRVAEGRSDAETYMGLVETGVGLIPAGGGTKELNRRLISRVMALSPDTPPLPLAQKACETIGQAKVSTSALEARTLGFLTEEDPIVMNPDHLLAMARREVLALAEDYRPPERGKNIYAAGKTLLAALEIGVRQLQWAGFATEYDGVVAEQLARALCGGELSSPQWVSEDYLLSLERQAFLSLLHNPKTLERIQAMLTTGKVPR